jgi:hypothetical protein
LEQECHGWEIFGFAYRRPIAEGTARHKFLVVAGVHGGKAVFADLLA